MSIILTHFDISEHHKAFNKMLDSKAKPKKVEEPKEEVPNLFTSEEDLQS